MAAPPGSALWATGTPARAPRVPVKRGSDTDPHAATLTISLGRLLKRDKEIKHSQVYTHLHAQLFGAACVTKQAGCTCSGGAPRCAPGRAGRSSPGRTGSGSSPARPRTARWTAAPRPGCATAAAAPAAAAGLRRRPRLPPVSKSPAGQQQASCSVSVYHQEHASRLNCQAKTSQLSRIVWHGKM